MKVSIKRSGGYDPALGKQVQDPTLEGGAVAKFDSILEFYKGKPLDIIRKSTIPDLLRSEEQGYWIKGVSRSVRAQLNKCNVAAKWARDVEKALEVDYQHPLHDDLTNLRYGSYGRASRMLTEAAMKKRNAKQFFYTHKGNAQNVNDYIERWAWAFAAVHALIVTLDERRPKQVVVMKTLSPTVLANISEHIGINLTTIQMAPMVGEWVDHTTERNGKTETVKVWRVRVEWPKGTLHNKSRFFHSGENWQCQACGHAIRNPFNWVPILAYGRGTATAAYTKDMPFSLLVGRDCAEKLFGCEVEGDMLIENR